MKTIDYDAPDKSTGNSETLVATDENMEKKYGNLQRAYEEGFAASSGVRAGTAETNGRVTHPEKSDEPRQGAKVSNHIEDENPGLADN